MVTITYISAAYSTLDSINYHKIPNEHNNEYLLVKFQTIRYVLNTDAT
jgi:hypothetical protein